jgi:hypothetical protein
LREKGTIGLASGGVAFAVHARLNGFREAQKLPAGIRKNVKLLKAPEKSKFCAG